MCSVKAWPLPKIDWYFNNLLVKEFETQLKSFPIYVSQQDGTPLIDLHLEINHLSHELTGVYTCLINGNITVKNYTLLLKSHKKGKIN